MFGKLNNFRFHNRLNINILVLIFSSLVFRLFLANFGTLQLDHGTFIAWATRLATYGLSNFYNEWSDYLPGYLYILFWLGKLNSLPEYQTILFKLPAIISDIATGYLIYKIVGKKYGIIAFLFYVFNPAIFSNSTLWGQADSLTALFSLFSVYIFPTNYLLSSISLAIGTLIKPQAAFILPAILYMLYEYRTSLKRVILYGLIGLSTFIAGFVPFNSPYNGLNLYEFILERLSISSSQYPYGSVNAFSFWGLFGFWKPDSITFWVGLGLSVVLITLVILITLRKNVENRQYLISALSILTTFMFMTRMHERHLLPALPYILVSAFSYPSLWVVYAGLSVSYVANLAYAYYWITDNFKEIFNHILVKFFIIFNIGLWMILVVNFFKKINLSIGIKFKKTLESNTRFGKSDISSKKASIVLSLIMIFTLLTRLYGLGDIKVMYFDEIYHSFTARLVLQGDPKAWEWWNPHPEGFAYEWTHPPVSKLGMALGMKIFGDNSFGWRVPQAVVGTLSILVVYLLAKKIFNDRLLAIFAASVMSLEGLHLVLSRMGMNDVYVLLFALLAIYLFIRNDNFLSSISLGLAIASKWSAIYVLPIIFVSHFVFKKKFDISYLYFLIFPILVYVASYTIMFTTGHTWDQFVEVQKQMWWYHTNLEAEHPYTSPAWSWPLNLRPVYLYDGQIVDNLVARIYAIGNPLVLWFGLISIIFSIVISYKEKVKKLGFVVFAYLVLFLPWIASPRIMFFYHYLPSIPFLVITIAFILRRFPKLVSWFLISSFVLYVYFFPHWTGIRIPVWLDESYYWLNSWR